jgi:hypothetical protein
MIAYHERRHRFALNLLLLSVASSILSANALPHFLVMTGRPKCITAEVPKMTLLKIHYEAPGIILILCCGKLGILSPCGRIYSGAFRFVLILSYHDPQLCFLVALNVLCTPSPSTKINPL